METEFEFVSGIKAPLITYDKQNRFEYREKNEAIIGDLKKAKIKHRLTEHALDDIEAFTEFLESVEKLDERKIAEKYEFNERRDSLHYYAKVMGPQ